MNTALLLLLLVGGPIAGVLVVLLVVCWVAAGSHDVNGSPERDAGWTDREIEERSRSWDHGSHQTESRPCLDYAIARNEQELAALTRQLGGH